MVWRASVTVALRSNQASLRQHFACYANPVGSSPSQAAVERAAKESAEAAAKEQQAELAKSQESSRAERHHGGLRIHSRKTCLQYSVKHHQSAHVERGKPFQTLR